MFFLLSKLFWTIAQPSNIILFLVLLTGLLLGLKRLKTARWTGIAAALLLFLAGASPMATWLIRSLEDIYPRAPAPAHLDGILVLGGGNRVDILLARGSVGVDSGLPRLVDAAILAQRYPAARIVFSGGSGDPAEQDIVETIAARHILTGIGIPLARLTLEGKSRNTWENFVYAKAMAKPKPGETWLLVTSAFHMPRAMAIAKKVGWNVQPWPSDYMTAPQGYPRNLNISRNLERTNFAVHEYLGLLVYRLTGKAS